MSIKMKICYFADAGNIHHGRAEGFANRDYEVHLISFKNAEIENVNVHYIGPFIYIPHFSILALLILKLRPIKKLIKEINPDIIHGHYLLEHGFYAVISGFKPMVVSAMGGDIETDIESSKINRLLYKFIFKKADVIHAHNEPAKRRLVELGCNEKKIFVQPWGIDTHRFSPNAKSQVLKEKLGIVDKYSVINARTLNDSYHVDIFIKAIPQVLKSINNVKFIIGGSGPSESKLMQLANKLGVSENVVFLGGTPHEEMSKYLASADIYNDTYFPTTKKAGAGIGTTTMEAMACGTPQIMAERPSIVEQDNFFHGVSYKPDDPKDLAEKIVYLLKNKELRDEIGRKSRKIALEIYDGDKNIEKFEQLYENLINKYKHKK